MTGILDEILAHLREDSKTWKNLSKDVMIETVDRAWISGLARKEYESDLEMIKKIEKFKESLKEVVE
jgi:hypothetical protein